MNILRHIPNAITCSRLVLIGPFLGALFNGNYELAFYLYILAGLSDGLDGYLARHFNWQTKFGGFIDPLADKLLVFSSVVSLAYIGKLPLWLMAMVIVRDAAIMSGVLAWYYWIGKVDFEPSFLSKLNTVLQILLILVLLFELTYAILPSYFIDVSYLVVAFSTILSFIDYIWYWGGQAFKLCRRV